MVLTASTDAYEGTPLAAIYAASKGAQLALTCSPLILAHIGPSAQLACPAKSRLFALNQGNLAIILRLKLNEILLMMSLKMFQVDAFSDQVFSGNPAAVLILDDWLSDNLMQFIAAENNLAETAFARRTGQSWDLRWFTPMIEVDFCGHATLAAAHVLVTEYGVAGPLSFSTRVGHLKVEVTKDGYLLDLPCIPPEEMTHLPEIISPVFSELAVSWFRNFENIFVVMNGENAVRTYQPDMHALAGLGPVGVVVTGQGTNSQYDFVSRYFAPGAGIPEDPVTGSIHATLVPYWVEKLGKNKLSAWQASHRGGHLLCELKEGRVVIEGKAVTFMKADIFIID